MPNSTGMMDDFRPIIPSLIRLIAGVIVLVAVQTVVLGFPGINQVVSPSTITVAALVSLLLGFVVSIVVLKFGTQLSNAIGEAYSSMKAYTPLLSYFFQVATLWILYNTSKAVMAGFFSSAPWLYPLIFLVLGIIPTVKVVVNIVHVLEGHGQRRSLTRDQV